MKFYHIIIVGIVAATLTACVQNHNLYLVGRGTGATAKTTITTAGNQGGDVSIELKGQTYTGHWVYMANGGMVGVGTAAAFSGVHSAYGTNTMVASSTMGGGTLLASAPDGSQLRCTYSYNSLGKSGIGECQDSSGETYDLQIN